MGISISFEGDHAFDLTHTQDRMHLDCVFSIVGDDCCIMLEDIMGEASPLRRLVDEYVRNPATGEYTLRRWAWCGCWHAHGLVKQKMAMRSIANHCTASVWYAEIRNFSLLCNITWKFRTLSIKSYMLIGFLMVL